MARQRGRRIMTITLSAAYDDGTLTLDAPLNLSEKTTVRVTIEEPTLGSDDPTDWETADELRCRSATRVAVTTYLCGPPGSIASRG